MREIKFRIWDGEQMQQVGVIDLDAERSMDYYNWYDGYSGENYPFERYPLMQFTGLKDKNGKEIYEGDIVRLIEPNRLYTVEWLECTFKLVHADPKLDRMHWGSINRVPEMNWGIQVAGNIYENPELLAPTGKND